MKITKHAGGTFTLTDVTPDEIGILSFGLCTAAAFYASHPVAETERRFREESQTTNERLYRVFNGLERARYRGSITLTPSYVGLRKDAFKVEKVTGLTDWENERLFDHCDRAES